MRPTKVWNDGDAESIGAALARARDGHTSILVVEGEAGLGKTALLSELTVRAGRDVQVRWASGLEGDRSSFSLLAQWGAQPVRPTDGGEPSVRVAAQALRDCLDSLALTGPVLLVADDLHWADPGSVDALLWLLRRTWGDRLLVAVGTRPAAESPHTGWRRWTDSHPDTMHVRLNGLSPHQVAHIARTRWPNATDDAARRLHEHTGGNPLYLTMLLAEHDLAELTHRGVLPAPAAFARTIATRTARLDATALVLLRATCVLGSGWSPLSLVSATAELADSAPPAQKLADAELVELRRNEGLAQLRPSHALIRASVYQQTPLPELRALHQRAAGLVEGRAAALAHRMAGAEQYDASLADEMQAYAGELYRQRSFRQAAQYLRWASGLTPDPATRERRWLDSVFTTMLTYDFAAVESELGDVRAAGNVVWRGLVLGLYGVWQRRYRDGVAALEPLRSVSSTAEPLARYRAEVLLAWARLCLGQPTESIADALTFAAESGATDVAFTGLEMIAASQVSIRAHGIRPVLERLSALPSATAVPLEATAALAYRGSLRTVLGLTREASEDLGEATRRIVDGVIDFGAGSFHAQLGFVHWLTGDWGRARLSFHQAIDLAPVIHQVTAALAALVDISCGRFDEADARIEQTRQLLVESPWREACDQFAGTLLVRAHAGGSPADQSAALSMLRGTPFEVTEVMRISPTLLLNYIPALIWAKRLDEASVTSARLEEITPASSWAPAVAAWYRGLIAEARGDGAAALRELTSAVEGGLDLPLYRAHLLADHARIARLLGRAGTDATLREAEAIYEQLGATPYLARIRAIRAAAAPPIPTSAALPGGVTLTEREQDVLTLLVAGMSYAQISRELFITQSTVGYHLSNMYDKAGVSSRHQLSALARANPQMFGISIAPSV